MSIRDHRTGRNLVRTRLPKRVTKFEEVHKKPRTHEPIVCQTCRGVGTHPDYPGVECWVCGGEGEI